MPDTNAAKFSTLKKSKFKSLQRDMSNIEVDTMYANMTTK